MYFVLVMILRIKYIYPNFIFNVLDNVFIPSLPEPR